jgi:hypothetical protein
MNDDLNALRRLLFETARGVKDGSIDSLRARVIREIGDTLVDTEKLVIDHRRLDQDVRSTFVDMPHADELPNGITGIVRHRLAG